MIRTVDLKYYFLQYRFLTVRFRAEDTMADWLEGAACGSAELLPPADAPSDCGLVIVRSQPLAGTLPTLTRVPGWLRYLRSRYPRRYIELSGTFQDYLGRFSGKSRSTLKRKVRRFARACGGTLDARQYRTTDEMPVFHRLALEVSRKTYQERYYGAGLPEGEEYLHELVDSAGREAVRGYLLFKDSRPVAYLLCPVERGRVLYGYLGHDPEVASLSPGTVLQYFALEKLFEESRFRLFDFTEGDGPHKAFFATHHRDCGDVFFFRRGARNDALVFLHHAVARASAGTLGALDRLGLRARLKRWTRGAARRPDGREGAGSSA